MCWPVNWPTGPGSSRQNEHWVAFVPFAARWPVEVHLYPRRQVRDLTGLDGVERAALAGLYLEVITRMEGVFEDTLPAITGVHQAPVHAADTDFRLHLEVLSIRRDVGKLKYLAGSESAMGAFVNDITPEVTAQRLRAVHTDTGNNDTVHTDTVNIDTGNTGTSTPGTSTPDTGNGRVAT